MEKKLMLIANPNAGRGRARTALGAAIEVFAQCGFLTTVYLTRDRGDAARFAGADAGGYELCVACGGDGTLSEVISGLIRHENPPPLGYIPMGTANDVAISLNLPKNVKRAARAIMDGQIIDYDVGLFNDDYFTYIAAFGAFTEVSYQTPQDMKARVGQLAYILEGMRQLPKITPCHARIECGTKIIEDDFIFGGVMNSTSMAGFVRLKPDEVGLGDGLFEVMLIKAPKDIIELSLILNSITQNNYDQKYVNFFHCRQVKFTFMRPTAWTRDGEDGGEHLEVLIKNLHAAVEFVVPPTGANWNLADKE